MRKAGELFYILGDHLGSTSIVANADGTKVSEIRYPPAFANAVIGGISLIDPVWFGANTIPGYKDHPYGP